MSKSLALLISLFIFIFILRYFDRIWRFINRTVRGTTAAEEDARRARLEEERKLAEEEKTRESIMARMEGYTKVYCPHGTLQAQCTSEACVTKVVLVTKETEQSTDHACNRDCTGDSLTEKNGNDKATAFAEGDSACTSSCSSLASWNSFSLQKNTNNVIWLPQPGTTINGRTVQERQSRCLQIGELLSRIQTVFRPVLEGFPHRLGGYGSEANIHNPQENAHSSSTMDPELGKEKRSMDTELSQTNKSPAPMPKEQQERAVSDECIICLETYQTGQDVSWSANPACPHAFHHACILEWLMAMTRTQLPVGICGHKIRMDELTCPCCRLTFLETRAR